EDEVDRVARKSVASDGEARHALALQDLETHADDARQEHIGRERIDETQRQNCRQPAVGEAENEDDQPDAEGAQREDGQAPTDEREKPHRPNPNPKATISAIRPSDSRRRSNLPGSLDNGKSVSEAGNVSATSPQRGARGIRGRP